MKHIKKRFLLEADSSKVIGDSKQFTVIENLKNGIDHQLLAKKNNYIVFIETDDKRISAGFAQNINGKNYVLPMLDPSLAYFHSSQTNLNQANLIKPKLLEKLDLTKQDSRLPIHELYDFYGISCSVIINLFTSIECFNNQLIPENFIFKKNKNKFTESYNYSQILEYVDFKTKVTEIIPEITGKNFFLKQSSESQMIWNLKDFRDKIIHTKPNDDDLLKYKELIKRTFNFKYEKALMAVAKYCNYYKHDHIIECDCENEF